MDKILETLLTEIIKKEYFTDQVLHVIDSNGYSQEHVTSSTATKILEKIIYNNQESIKKEIYPLIEARLKALIEKWDLDQPIIDSYIKGINNKPDYYKDSDLQKLLKDLPTAVAQELLKDKLGAELIQEKINYKGITEAIENGTLKINITIS